MTPNDIEIALKAHIGNGGLSWPIAWPNQDLPDPAPQPRIEVSIDPNEDDDVALSGGVLRSEGFVVANVIVQKGTSTSAAGAKAAELRDLFPKGLRLPAGAGHVTIVNIAGVRRGFPDGPDWVVPVVIPYRAEAIYG